MGARKYPTGTHRVWVTPNTLVRLRTTNGLERLNREIKRRTRMASIFPNEASLLRLASALLVEIDDEWQTGKIYLNMKSEKI